MAKKITELPVATEVSDDDPLLITDLSTGLSKQADASLLGGGFGKLLFKWNELDVSQFDIANTALVGTASNPDVSVVTINGKPHVRFRVDKSGAGVMHASVPILGLDLPDRYVMMARVRQSAGVAVEWGGWLYMSNGLAGLSHQGFAILGDRSGGQSYTPAFENGVALTTATALAFGEWGNLAGNDMGQTHRLVVNAKNPPASGNVPEGEIGWNRLGIDVGVSQRWDITDRAAAYPLAGANWNPPTLTKAGIAMADFTGAVATLEAAFSDIAIFGHWMDA